MDQIQMKTLISKDAWLTFGMQVVDSEESCNDLPSSFDDVHVNHQYQQLCATWLKIQTEPQQRHPGHPGPWLWLQHKHYV